MKTENGFVVHRFKIVILLHPILDRGKHMIPKCVPAVILILIAASICLASAYIYVYEQQSSSIFQTILDSASSSFRYAIAYSTYLNPDTMGSLKTVEIATDGTITDTIIDNLNFDSNWGEYPSAIHVSGDIYAIAYTGADHDGFLTTVQIAIDGQITDTVIDTLEFDTDDGGDPNIISISGDVYAIAYSGKGDDGFLKTVEIASNGQITDTVIDVLEFDDKYSKYSNILHLSGNIYAIVYTSDGDDGNLKTVEIASNGQITDTVIDVLEFDTVYVANPDIIPVSGNIYAIAYVGGLDGNSYIKTVTIATDGFIGSIIDTLTFVDFTLYEFVDIIHISGDVYAIAHDAAINGYLKTVEIYTDGQIKDTVNDNMMFHNSYVSAPDIIHVSGNIFAIAYQGNYGDGYLNTVEIATNGQITDTVIDELEFDTNWCNWPDIIQLSES